MIRLAVTARLA